MRAYGALALAIGMGIAAGAQGQQAPVFRGGVSLVAIDVNVLDSDGKPTPGLTADDFEVKLDGRLQVVRAVSYESSDFSLSTTPSPSAAVASRVEATNVTAAPEPRFVVVLFDDLSVAPTRSRDVLFAGARFVERLPPTDMVGFATTSGVGAINPTRNRAPIQAALRHSLGAYIQGSTGRTSAQDANPDLPLGRDEAVEVDAGNDALLRTIVARDCFPRGNATAAAIQSALNGVCGEDIQRKVRETATLVHRQTESQISSYSAVIRAMRAAPGRKIVVLLTDGLLITQRGKDGTVALEEISHAAAAGGVELSVLFASPDDVSMTTRSPDEAAVARADGLSLMTGIQTVADITGGTFWRVMGQPERFFDFVGQATSGVYHLGVEAPPGAAKRDFQLSVHVKRPGVTVRANHVAVPPTGGVVESADDQVRAAIAVGAPHYGVPMSVAALVRRGKSISDLQIDTNVDVPGNPPGPLEVTFGLVDQSGSIKTGRTVVPRPTLGDEYRVSTALPVQPGTYALRFAVKDNAGHVGSIETRINARLNQAGPLLTSDLVTAWSGPDGKPQFPALGEIPGTATSYGGLLEIYAGTSPAQGPSRVQWTVLNDAQQTIASQSSPPIQNKDAWLAHAEFPTSTLANGDYELRATILIGDQSVGSSSAILRRARK